MNFEYFKKLEKREVNKSIAKKLGFVCDENWEFNENATKHGVDSLYYANLTIRNSKNDSSIVGWNPFTSSADAFNLMIDMNLGMPAVFEGREDARNLIVYYAYLESLK